MNDLLYRILSKCFLGALLALAMGTEARALLITPTTTPSIMEFSMTSEAQIIAAINNVFNPDPVLAYKQNFGGSEEGPFASSYTTTFSNSTSDPSNATIDYIGGSFISNPEKYLLVKDGNHTPTGYLYNISLWDGMEDLVLENFWPQGGAISHVSILTRGSAQVPDGGATLMLLGIGLMSVLTIRRLGLPPTR
jgi:hypothetical protein